MKRSENRHRKCTNSKKIRAKIRKKSEILRKLKMIRLNFHCRKVNTLWIRGTSVLILRRNGGLQSTRVFFLVGAVELPWKFDLFDWSNFGVTKLQFASRNAYFRDLRSAESIFYSRIHKKKTLWKIGGGSPAGSGCSILRGVPSR